MSATSAGLDLQRWSRAGSSTRPLVAPDFERCGALVVGPVVATVARHTFIRQTPAMAENTPVQNLDNITKQYLVSPPPQDKPGSVLATTDEKTRHKQTALGSPAALGSPPSLTPPHPNPPALGLPPPLLAETMASKPMPVASRRPQIQPPPPRRNSATSTTTPLRLTKSARSPTLNPAEPPATAVWERYESASGRPYFHNPATNETTWTAPASAPEAATAPAAPAPPPAPREERAFLCAPSGAVFGRPSVGYRV